MSTNKLRGAVIGYGFISGKGHIPAYLDRTKWLETSGQGKGPNNGNDIEIVAIADICPGRREVAKKVLPNARIYDSYEALLAAEAKNLDFVDISTPPCDHAKIAHAALDKGLHVLCEKPLATTLQDAREMLEHAKRAERVLFPVHNYKHAPVVKIINEIIRSGRIGKVRSLTLNTYRNTHAKGVTEWHTHWRREHRYSGGGIAMDHGSHTFYLTFEWMGTYPTSVTAKMSNMDAHKWDTEDNFSTTLTFPNGLAAAHLTWTAGTRKAIYTVQGEKGAITVDNDDIQIDEMIATKGPDVAQGAVEWKSEKKVIASHWMDASHVQWFNSLVDQFKDAIHKGEWVGKEARESYLCIQLITTAYKSAQEGCKELPLSQETP